MKKIGIFMAFAPEQQISNQGIGRLTAFILNAIIRNDNLKVSLAVPAWYVAIIMDFLADQRIDSSKIEIITTNGIPLLLRMRTWVNKFLGNNSKKKYLQIKLKAREKIESIYFNLLVKGLSTSSSLKFILLIMIVVVFVTPLAIVGMVALFILRLIKRGLRWIESKIGLKIGVTSRFLLTPLSTFRRNVFVHRLYQGVRNTELSKLIHKINNKKDIDVWFIPTLFWPEIAGIKGKKVVAAPDIVFLEFPMLFSSPFFGGVCDQITKTIRVSDHFVCYSEHVKLKHLMEGFFVDSKQVSVVKHGAINLSSFLDLSLGGVDCMKHAACHILRDYQKNHLNKSEYLKDFDLTSTKFIFYSSQIRPHKNFLSLIMAYEKLLRNRFVNFKLITTASLMHDKNVWDYIVEKRLQYDILCFPHVSSEVLAALNHLAVCAVNPTLFEGGFPFTFSEAYSVGTPSVMSNIPVVLDEVTDPALQEKMLFDPYHLDDMVNKIEWAVNHRDELLALEEPLYRKLNARDWEMVANDYIEVFKSVVGGEREVFA